MIKFNFKPLSIKVAEDDVRKKLKKLTQDEELLNQIGDRMIQDLKFQARKGTNPVTGGKFIPLSPKWIKERQKIAEAQSVHETFKANRSNVTITGQLLDALRRNVLGRKLIIFFDGIHKPYKAKRVRNTGQGNRTIGKPIKNSLLAEYVNQIRPFFIVREKLLPQLKSIVIRYIRRNL